MVVRDGERVIAHTINGQPCRLLPGEYEVHLLPSKVPGLAPTLRIIAAGPRGQDLHMRLSPADEPHAWQARAPSCEPGLAARLGGAIKKFADGPGRRPVQAS